MYVCMYVCMCVCVCVCVCMYACMHACCGGSDEKIPPAPRTNQIAGFVEFRPLTSREKDKKLYLDSLYIKIVRTRKRIGRHFVNNRTLLGAHYPQQNR